jgi:RND family efflux transporter MFP subunit
MKKHLPTITVLLVLFVAAGGVAWVWWSRPAPEAVVGGGPQSGPVAVEATPIEGATLYDARVLTGTLESSARFTVATKVGGLVQSVLVDLGDRVEQGQMIARIDDAELVQAVAQAEADLAVRRAELARARSELSLARREFERSERLRERGIAAESQLDEISARLGAAEATVQLAEAQVTRAESAVVLRRIELGYTQVTAAWSEDAAFGSVAERFQDPGNTVTANAPMVTVVSLDPLKAVVTVTERDYAGLRVGQAASVTTDGAPGRTFAATVERIAPVFSESSRQARIELSVPNADGLLRPGMFVRVRIVLGSVDAAAVVPRDALARRGGRPVLFVLEGGGGDTGEGGPGATVRMVPVTTGIVDSGRVEIVEPAIAGRVVTLGQQLLSDGSEVRVVESRAGGGRP